jgi:uncharacterized protein YjbI with pentapeptide repeats
MLAVQVMSPWPIPVQPHAPVVCGAALWQKGKHRCVTVVVKATFGLVHEANARLVAPADIAREDRHRAGGCLEEASELAPYLPSAGVILVGSAHAPRGQPAAALAVRLGVFRERPLLNKVLHVIGNRTREAPARAQPFESMPLTYERAFGGPGTDDNPVGTGHHAGSPLPNIVDPQVPTRPAGYGPIPRHWGPRRRLLGSRHEPALSEIPDGFPFPFFHAAPGDQQIPPLIGDEWIVLDGLHPSVPNFRTRLPNVRAHVRWHLVGAAGAGPAHAIDLLADTLVITPESQICSIVWRGHVAMDPADAARMRAAAAIELQGFPLSSAFAAEAATPAASSEIGRSRPAPLEEAPAPEDTTATGVLDLERLSAPATPFASQGSPSGASSITQSEVRRDLPDVLPFRPATPGQPLSPAPLRPVATEAAGEVEGSTTQLIDLVALSTKAIAPFALAAPGAKADAIAPAIPGAPWTATPAPIVPPAVAPSAPVAGPGTPPDAPAPLPALVELPPVRASADGPVAATSEPIAPPAEISAPAEVTTRAEAPSNAVRPVTTGGDPPQPEASPAVAEAPTGLRATVVARVAAREPLLDLALSGADLHDLDLAGALLARANLQGTKLTRCKLMNARLSGAQLADADLSDADLTGADLVNANLARANVARARFDGAVLTDATFSQGQGAGASFAGAAATRSIFARGTWDGASFARLDAPHADFGDASLERARFESAVLSEALLDGARGAGAVFDGARLAQARAVGASFAKAQLRAIDAPRSNWERATLDGAELGGANLKEASLSRATCMGTSFAGAVLVGANLQRLTGDGADLKDADLQGADLRQAKLHEASFEGAALREVSGAKADLVRSRFVRANLQGATLRGARLGGASFAHADLERADLYDADLEGANIFGASRKTAKLGAGVKSLIEVDPDAAPRASDARDATEG